MSNLEQCKISLQIHSSLAKTLQFVVVDCQYSMATYSTSKRKRRPHGDCTSIEMTLHLKQTFEATILTQLHPRSQIYIYVQILQADGSNYCTCVNAAILAVIVVGIPMWDYMCTSSASFIENTPLADLSYVEESAGGSHLFLALLPKSEQITLLEMNLRLHEDHLE
ncbi:unnamed protein product [Ranitomeya imitator]|uniref:Uncharacterized protein n=1 Tax=Ranitomeya imitator TaxID=111125 RepID=A0ABN9M2I9_9NEOB|nr:unnamed protein product [Ranitomeya imitator]